MERRKAFRLALAGVGSLVLGFGGRVSIDTGNNSSVSAQEMKKVLLLRGYADSMNEVWFKRAEAFCTKRGYSLELVNTPSLVTPVRDEEGRRREYFEVLHKAVTRDQTPKHIYGISAGGGGLQMYLDYLSQRFDFPVNSLGEPLIKEVGFLSSRNLYSEEMGKFLEQPHRYSNPLFVEEFQKIPPSLLSFYRGISSQRSIEQTQSHHILVKVRYGTDDTQVPKRNSFELSSLFGVPVKGIAGGHMAVAEEEPLYETITSMV